MDLGMSMQGSDERRRKRHLRASKKRSSLVSYSVDIAVAGFLQLAALARHERNVLDGLIRIDAVAEGEVAAEVVALVVEARRSIRVEITEDARDRVDARYVLRL